MNGLGLFAKKLGMTQLFMEDGLRVPATILAFEPNVVIQKKTLENDGYTSIQVGFDAKREKLSSKAMAGHFKKANVAPQRYIREMRVDDAALGSINVGDALGY